MVGQGFPASANIKNIEILNIANDTAAVSVDSGKYGFNTVNATASSTVDVTNGKAVTVKAAGGTVNVSGAELNAVSVADVTTGALVTVLNQTAAGANATTLTAVSLENLSGNANLTGDAIAAISLKSQKAASAVVLTNAASTALAVNVDGVGYNAAGTVVAVSVAAGAKAENITVNATGAKSNVTVTAAAAKNLIITGTADLTLGGIATTAALKSIDGSAATGGLTLGALNAGTADVKTGAGKDSFTVQANKVTVDAGAGNDTVTLGSALAIGSTVKLGAGDDVLLSASGSVAAKDATGTVVIDGGDGIDTVAASLINATNASQFVNFERIDLSKQGAAATVLDIALMTGSTITGLTLNGDGAGANAGNTVQNLAAGAGLTVAGSNTGTTTIGVKDAATNTADTFGITFAGQAAAGATAAIPTVVAAGTVGLEGVETVTIASSGTGFVANSLALAANTKLKTITITGDKALDLSFTAANGTTGATTGVSSIDASASTGALKVDLANVKGVTAGVTVKGGSAADTFTTSTEVATLTGGAGNDKFIVTATVSGATTAASAKIVSITDFQAGDSITGVAVTNANEIGKITLTAGVQNLDQAFALLGDNTSAGANKDVQWFNYGSDTYVVFNDGTAGLSATDVVIKLTGTIDLSNATVTTAGVLALA